MEKFGKYETLEEMRATTLDTYNSLGHPYFTVDLKNLTLEQVTNLFIVDAFFVVTGKIPTVCGRLYDNFYYADLVHMLIFDKYGIMQVSDIETINKICLCVKEDMENYYILPDAFHSEFKGDLLSLDKYSCGKHIFK